MSEDYRLDILSPELIDLIPLIVMGFDPDGNVLYWNKQARDATGYTRKEVLKKGVPLFLRIFLGGPGSKKKGADTLDPVFSGKKKLKGVETSIRSKNGDIRYIRWNSFIVGSSGASGAPAVIVTGQDVTDRRKLQGTLRTKEHYIKTATNRLKKYISLDPHTGLLNYRHFMHRLHADFYKALEDDRPLSLMIMDIDYFCSINSTHGVSKGNRILREFAGILKACTRRHFTVGRFSGTEFAVLMPGTDIKTAFAHSGRLFSRISDHNFEPDGDILKINVSYCMALGGVPHCEDVFTPEQLLDRVTDKLREAKRMGGNSMLICSPSEMTEQGMMAGLIDDDDLDYKYTVEFVNALANTVKTKDFYTQEHSALMSNYAVYMAEYMGMKEPDIRTVRFGSLLHDLGKIGIDKMILLKPAALTKEEFSLIKQHPRIGAEIIRNVHPLKDVVPLVLCHHERYDGSGYLSGLKGEEIPLGARIISLADVFQALTSDRPYRRAIPEKDAFSMIRSYSGSYFDPKVVKAFFEVYKAT